MSRFLAFFCFHKLILRRGKDGRMGVECRRCLTWTALSISRRRKISKRTRISTVKVVEINRFENPKIEKVR